MVFKRTLVYTILFVVACFGSLHAQVDVLKPYMKTDQFEFGEKVKPNDPRFKEINKDMGLYQPVTVPFKYLGLTVTEALISIENFAITRIVLFLSEAESGKQALNVLQAKLDKLNVKKGEDGVDHYWRSSMLEIIHQEGMGSDVIYLQPLTLNSEDPIPGTAD